jgi:hypothetical protein
MEKVGLNTKEASSRAAEQAAISRGMLEGRFREGALLCPVVP